ncbi:unnamed protein product, partial [Prorocentrum cordatum]
PPPVLEAAPLERRRRRGRRGPAGHQPPQEGAGGGRAEGRARWRSTTLHPALDAKFARAAFAPPTASESRLVALRDPLVEEVTARWQGQEALARRRSSNASSVFSGGCWADEAGAVEEAAAGGCEAGGGEAEGRAAGVSRGSLTTRPSFCSGKFQDAWRERARQRRLPMISEAFGRFASGAGAAPVVAASKLEWALRFAGHLNPDYEDVMQAKARLFPSKTFLLWSEFSQLEQLYDTVQLKSLEEQFHELDPNGTGFVGAKNVSALLRQMGFFPFPRLVEELLAEVAARPGGQRSAEDIMNIYEQLQLNSGFTSSQLEPLREAFACWARASPAEGDEDMRLDQKGLWAALRWLEAHHTIPEELR